jgi:peptide/nickel transport system ATP-binding protein
MKPILELQELTAGFQQNGECIPALTSVSFSLNENEILGIVGETGSGKSVLARAIMSLLPANSRILKGDIRFRGRSLLNLKPAEYRKLRGSQIALIATNAKSLLDPVERVGNQIARVLREHRQVSRRDARQAAIDLLAEVGIQDPAHRAESYPHQLSGGMAQRIVIAMALVAQPQVLLADDATLGLDATVQVQVLDMMVDRCRKLGLSVILITHDLGVVAHYCDRVAIMRDGRIIELKPVTGFLAAPEVQYSQELLQAAKSKDTEVEPSNFEILGGSHRSACILAVHRLTKTFSTPTSNRVVRAVDDVSFAIDRGETVALVGESGSGKTTIGQCLVRLLIPDSGKIIFDDQEVTGWTENRFRLLRQRIQIVFQEPYLALNPRWRVFDLVAEPLRLLQDGDRKKIMARVYAVLEMVKLPSSLIKAYPNELTAGEQKRLGIARALATEPDLVIFDEPTTALDIRVRAQIIQLVRDLQAETGLSALYITHDLNSVRSLAHRVAVMHRGRIVETGPTSRVFGQPEQSYTKTLLSAELPIEGPAGAEIAH